MAGKHIFISFVIIAALLILYIRNNVDNFYFSPEPGDDKQTEPTNWKLGAVIAASHSGIDLSWMDRIADDWTPVQYRADAWFPPKHLRLPANKGNEAMVYLTFIIDNYHDFPPYAVFTHGHLDSWHQEGDLIALVRALNLEALEREKYIALRCDWYPSCPAEIRPFAHDAVVWGPGVKRNETEEAIVEAWGQIFPGEEVPQTLASACCAQFAVTKGAVLSRKLEDYQRMREWLVNTRLVSGVSGRVFEKVWAYMFTGEAVRCPPPSKCACEFFGACQPIEWSVPPEGLGPLPAE